MTEEQKSYNATSKRLSEILGTRTPQKEERKKDLSFLETYIPKKKSEKKIEPSKELPKYILAHNTPIFESAEQIAAKLNSLPEGLGIHVIKGLPTMEDIVAHIKSLKGSERLDISNINNGEHISRMAQRVDMNDMRWHGGGSGSSTTSVNNEVVAGSGTTFTLAHVPTLNSQRIFAIGQRLTPTTDYTISGAVITTINSWNAGDILADYTY